MLNLDFVVGFALASDWMVDIIEVLLDNGLGCCCCTGVPQARVVYLSVQARTNRSLRQGFSGRYNCPPCPSS